ncbi:MAG: glycerophosphodiester phosphodiesterase family protein [Gammaproteobacteria bacterium]
MPRPVNIAHRGACGYLPEHSRGAKALAYAMGADYLEQDVIATRDGELVVLHDVTLDAVSDVRDRFPGRHRDDGHFYCIDFDLEELRRLRFHERVDPATGLARYPGRYRPDAGRFRVVTLDEEIHFVEQLNRSTGREVGIYPEIKSPEWHAREGIDLGSAVVDALGRHGYLAPRRKVFLQCYDPKTLRAARKRAGSDLPIVLLISSRTEVTGALLADAAGYANAIGPSITLIYRGVDEAGKPVLSSLVRDARALGLAVHPYTFRMDDLPDGVDSFEKLLEIFVINIGIEGIFTDFCDVVSQYLDRA